MTDDSLQESLTVLPTSLATSLLCPAAATGGRQPAWEEVFRKESDVRNSVKGVYIMVRTLAQNRHNKEICIQGQVGGYSVLHDYGDTGWKKLPRETGVGEEQLGRNLSGKQKGRLCSKNIRFRRVDKLSLKSVEFSVFSALAENVLNIFSLFQSHVSISLCSTMAVGAVASGK